MKGALASGKYRHRLHQCAAAGEEDRSVRAASRFNWSIHLDGDKEMHDRSVCQAGVYDRAVAALKVAKAKRLPGQHQLHLVQRCQARARRRLLRQREGASGSTASRVSPGYAYERAPDQQHFLNRAKTKQLFRDIFRRGARANAGPSSNPGCSSISSPATRPIIARPGAIRPVPCSAGSGPAICSARAMPRPSRS